MDIVEEIPRVGKQNQDRSYLASPHRAIQLKRLLTRSLDAIMQEDTTNMDVGTLTSLRR